MSQASRTYLRGLNQSKTLGSAPSNTRQYETAAEVEAEVNKCGFEACQLIVGIDFTKSNNWTGKNTFNGKCLHDVYCEEQNPYLVAMELVATLLDRLDDDHLIPCYGFGDVTTGRDKVFSFVPIGQKPPGFPTLVETYKQLAPNVNMSGPTNFAPLIHQAMRIVHECGMKLHILLILADGQVAEECKEDTINAIIDASKFPISIVMVGVGDGPWDDMKMFDEEVAERTWDNFTFVKFEDVKSRMPGSQAGGQEQSMFHEVFQEIPEQMPALRDLGKPGNSNAVQSIIDSLPGNLVIGPPSGH